MKNLLKFLDKKIYIIEIIYYRVKKRYYKDSAGVGRADGAVDSKQPDIKGT